MKKYVALVVCFLLVFAFLPLFQGRESAFIEKISQESTQKEVLSTLFLSELLDLSADKKQTHESFDLKAAKEALLSSSLIEQGRVSFAQNSHLLVSYVPVSPIAQLGDFENRAVDFSGNIFPVKPFFSKDALVKMYLGIEEVGISSLVGTKYEQKGLFAKKCLLDLLTLSLPGRIFSIDASLVEEKSLGKNEVVVVVEHLDRKDYLRLTKRNYLNEMSNYIILCDRLKEEKGAMMIDFRYDSCAFLEKFTPLGGKTDVSYQGRKK